MDSISAVLSSRSCTKLFDYPNKEKIVTFKINLNSILSFVVRQPLEIRKEL